MKILHTSDIHIDSPMSARLSPMKIRERRRELIGNFQDLVSEAIREGASAMIISGDLFDSEHISLKARDTVLDVILKNPSIAFFYLKGNHEGDALTNIDTPLPKNLFLFGDGWTYYAADGLTIAGRSTCSANMFETLELPRETKNIVILHGELRDKSAAPDKIGRLDAVGHNIDYMALGHYHSHSEIPIDTRGVAVYSGTPEGRGFDEIGDRGYIIINVGSEIGYNFRPFARRQLRIVALPLDSIKTPTELNEQAEFLLRDIPRSDIVRLELTGGYEPRLWKDSDALVRRFENRFYHFEVKDSSRIKIDPENFKNDKSFKGEFIRTVSSDPALDEDQKSKIIACGLYALLGENIYDS